MLSAISLCQTDRTKRKEPHAKKAKNISWMNFKETRLRGGLLQRSGVALATRVQHDMYKSAIVKETLLRATAGLLVLVLSVNLWCLLLDLAGTSQRTVNLT